MMQLTALLLLFNKERNERCAVDAYSVHTHNRLTEMSKHVCKQVSL